MTQRFAELLERWGKRAACFSTDALATSEERAEDAADAALLRALATAMREAEVVPAPVLHVNAPDANATRVILTFTMCRTHDGEPFPAWWYTPTNHGGSRDEEEGQGQGRKEGLLAAPRSTGCA